MSTSLNQIAGSLKVINDQKKIVNAIKQLDEKYKKLEEKHNKLQSKYDTILTETSNQKVIIEHLKESLSKQGNLLLKYIEKDIKPANAPEQELLFNKAHDLQRELLFYKPLIEESNKVKQEVQCNPQQEKEQQEKEEQEKEEQGKVTKKGNKNKKSNLTSINNLNRRMSIL